MKTLREHNEQRRQAFADESFNKPKPNGIECPKCGKELMDTCPNVTLTSNPPQKDVHCDSCDYRGYRFA